MHKIICKFACSEVISFFHCLFLFLFLSLFLIRNKYILSLRRAILFLSSHQERAHFENMEGMRRGGECSLLVTLFSEYFETPDMTSDQAWKIIENVSSPARVVGYFAETRGGGGSLVRNKRGEMGLRRGMYKG